MHLEMQYNPNNNPCKPLSVNCQKDFNIYMERQQTWKATQSNLEKRSNWKTQPYFKMYYKVTAFKQSGTYTGSTKRMNLKTKQAQK